MLVQTAKWFVETLHVFLFLFLSLLLILLLIWRPKVIIFCNFSSPFKNISTGPSFNSLERQITLSKSYGLCAAVAVSFLLRAICPPTLCPSKMSFHKTHSSLKYRLNIFQMIKLFHISIRCLRKSKIIWVCHWCNHW